MVIHVARLFRARPAKIRRHLLSKAAGGFLHPAAVLYFVGAARMFRLIEPFAEAPRDMVIPPTSSFPFRPA